jgi:CRISPR-associated protein Cas1
VTVIYLTHAGTTLAARSQSLVVRCGGATRARVPVVGVSGVVALAPAHLTSAAIALCARCGIELVVVPRHAGVVARLGASEAGLALRGAQHRRADEAEWCLELARAVVRGKIRNQRRLLGRSRGAGLAEVSAVRERLDQVLPAVERASTIATLRGLEGCASAAYFRGVRALVNPEFGFRARNRRPPRDPVNALLSFAYTLLTAEAAAAVAGAGLEPALGFFHRARAGRPALALDLVEEFRAPVADALVLRVTGRRLVRPAEFRAAGGGVRMRRAARGRFLEEYERRMATGFESRGGAPLTLREALRAQAVALARAVSDGSAYEPFQLP